MESAIVGNVLSEFRRRLWYLHEQNDTYRFDTQANLNLVIVQKEGGVSATDCPRRGRGAGPRTRHREHIAGSRTRRTMPACIIFPDESGDVADSAALGIVLLRPDMSRPR